MAKKGNSWERKITFWAFAVVITIVALILVYDSQTNVKDCTISCENKGFERSLYVKGDHGRKPECKCFNMVETEDGTIMVGEDKK